MASKKGAAEAAPVSSVDGIIDHLKKTSPAYVCRMTEAGSVITVPKFLSTGLPSVDYILGGGIPAGRFTELFSKGEGVGKTSLAAMCMAEMQRQGGTVVFIDTEKGLTDERLVTFGVNPENIIWVEPLHIENACQTIEQILDHVNKNKEAQGKVLVVWDSLTATSSKQEVESDYGDITVASSARALSASIKKLKDVMAHSECYIIGITQTRQNIGGGPFAEQHQAAGGLGVKYYAAQRIVMYRGQSSWLKEGTQRVGVKVSMHTEKSRLAAPYRKAEAHLLFETGYDRWKSLFDLLLLLNVVEQSAGYYTIIGREKSFRQAEFQEVLAELEAKDKLTIVERLKAAKITLPAIQYFIPEAE
jgi:recombination protein RecA